MSDDELSYIPGLISAYRAGVASDHVHLGYWPTCADISWPQAQIAMTQLHLDALAMRDGQFLLDIGCGIGGTIRMANDALHDATFVGVNIDPRQLDVCREVPAKNGNKIAWHHATAVQIPCKSASIDRVLSLEAMFHFPDRQLFLTEVARVLRPGGICVCSDIHFAPCNTQEAAACLDAVVKGYAPWPDPNADVAGICAMAKKAGLHVEVTIDISAHVQQTWRYIVSSRAVPLSSPHAAMARLGQLGLMSYTVFSLTKRH